MNYLSRISLFSVIFFLNISISTANNIYLKEKNVVSVCSYTEFTPISYGKGMGYEADLLKAIAQRLKMKIKFYPQNTYEKIWLAPNAPHSPCDIAMGGITPEQYRINQGAKFSNPTATYKQSLLIRKKDYLSGTIVSYASFKQGNKKIGVVTGTTGEKYAYVLAKKYGLPCRVIVQYPSESKLLPLLLSGKVDAIARGEIGNEYQTSQNKNLLTIAKHDFHDGFAYAVNPANKKLLVQLNQTIAEVTHHGKIGYAQWSKNHNVFAESLGTHSSIVKR